MGRNPGLYVYEWLAVVSIIAFAIVLTWLSHRQPALPHPDQLGEPQYLVHPRFEIKIEGAVAKPGVYQVAKGQTLKELLEMAEVLPEASLKGLKLNSKLRRGQVIHIPTQAMIQIYIQGAVKHPGPVTVPKGSRLNMLLDKVEFHDDADTHFLQKKRYLHAGEVIDVPLK